MRRAAVIRRPSVLEEVPRAHVRVADVQHAKSAHEIGGILEHLRLLVP